ncbi:MAG: hypothetical protein ACLQUY_10890 [Ktedonobacterales bacterium]
MSTQQPRGRQPRSGGGRALMLLGVLLALLSGVLVIFIVSNATATAGQTEQLVVATQNVPAGTMLSVSQIPTDFSEKSYPLSLVPAGAYVFTTQAALQVKLNQTVVTATLYPGDVLLASDPRIQPLGEGVPGSVTNINPNALTAGDILYPLAYSSPTGSAAQPFVVAGDHVDIIVTECGADWTTDDCATQTTFQDLYIYATFNNSLILALAPEDAQRLQVLAQTGKLTLAVLKPGNNTPQSTVSVTPAQVASYFNFH